MHVVRLGETDRAAHQPLDPGPKINVFALNFLGVVLAHLMLVGIDVPLVADYDIAIGGEDVDAVALCTPNSTHAALAIAAARAGKHIFCEKPMANTSAK